MGVSLLKKAEGQATMMFQNLRLREQARLPQVVLLPQILFKPRSPVGADFSAIAIF